MARWVKLTAGHGPQSVYVNLDQAAWIRPAEQGVNAGAKCVVRPEQ